MAAGMTVYAQAGSIALDPTRLGAWSKPSSVGITDIDNYFDACDTYYGQAVDIRRQYETVASSGGGSDAGAARSAYEKLIERIDRQQEIVSRLRDMASAAIKGVPLGLRAIQLTREINQAKDAVVAAMNENDAVRNAARQQLESLHN